MNDQNLTIKNLLAIIKQLNEKVNLLRTYIVTIKKQIQPVIKNYQQRASLLLQNANERADKLFAFKGKYSFGGLIAGVGFGDTIPILATPGEFVIRKEAVKYHGINIFTALNKATFDRNKLPDAIQNYAESLAAENKTSLYKMPLRFSGGGMIPQVEPKNNIVLDFKGGKKVTLQGTRDMVEELITQLRRERLTTIN